ncbi:MAG: NTP transferase domain-containing protein [Puniceicoccales bacterium]
MSTANETAPLMGLVLAGGQSRRMGRDKATLTWHGEPLWRRQAELLAEQGMPVGISLRAEQTLDIGGFAPVHDAMDDAGPLAGFLSAWAQFAQSALLVVACDLPLLDAATIRFLIEQRDPTKLATAYRSANDGLPEPLCAIWEPRSRAALEASVAAGKRCPRKVLINGGDDVRLLDLPHPTALENANTPEEFARLEALMKKESTQ